MRAKIGVVIAGAAFAMFALGRAESLRAGRGFADSLAWAQEADDQADDAAVSQDETPQDDTDASQDDAASADDATNSAITNKDVAGIYSGVMMDDARGAGTYLGGFITGLNSHTKLSGTFTDSLDGTGFVQGKVNSSGGISLKYRLKVKGGCIFSFKGTFENGNEIMGTYNRAGCKGGPGQGTLDIIKQ